ncbi:MAG: hypothetical protein M1818_007379 [Claussenomyces sp. TS43310]|nr:MAG: hypothetical protein M1818_007379 [Claussenomyces sp. TS43310]
MAGTSPRRSVRSRTTQPHSGSHHSSASSSSSSRADRNTRTSAKIESPRKSTPSGSPFSDPPDDTVAPTIEDALQTRRKKRGQGGEEEMPRKQTIETSNPGDEGMEDDEAVRCICSFDEYPGPPQLTDDEKKLVSDSAELEFITVADYTDDLAGFFLQCDMCKVWQHGGCVGIKNEDMSPDEYFCELCRKDLHRVFTASNGQKYSQYLPLYRPASRPASSRAASFAKDGTRSPRGTNGRASSAVQSSKRRSTMNSRDAAYDEEEQLRRAIEASKGEKSGDSTDGGTRRGKRGRSDSEEKPEGPKRQRTASASPSPSREIARFASQHDSDEDTKVRSGGARKIRGAAARNHREKEMREERERQRTEAANKRKGRAERRRVEDSEPPEEAAETATAATTAATAMAVACSAPRALNNKPAESMGNNADPPASSQPVAPDTPPTATPQQPSTSHKKGGRPPHGRKGKLGKNQYTRDRDHNGNDEESPGRSHSRDVVRGDDNHHGHGHGHGHGHRGVNGDSKASRSKGGGSKITFLDMKRKVAWMLDFISKTQLDMASETVSPPNGEAEAMIRGLAGSIIPMLHQAESGEQQQRGAMEKGDGDSQKDFRDLKLLEMMDVLTRMLVKWQKQYA